MTIKQQLTIGRVQEIRQEIRELITLLEDALTRINSGGKKNEIKK